MTNQNLIKKYLPQSLWTIANWYNIPEKFLKNRPDLIILILQSKSMDTQKEKQSWFNLLPLMNKDQLKKLDEILTREKEKLQEIEKKYEEKKSTIKEKYIKRRESMWYNKKIHNIKEKEKETHIKEAQEADKLLENI